MLLHAPCCLIVHASLALDFFGACVEAVNKLRGCEPSRERRLRSLEDSSHKRVDVVPAGDATVGFLFMTPPKCSNLPASRTGKLLTEPHLKQGVQEGI